MALAPGREPSASAIRIATRAVLILVPITLTALGVPRVLRALRQPAPASAGAVLGGAATAVAPPAVEEKPRPPESPTPEQIERARAAQVELGRAQKGWQAVTVIMPRAGTPGADGQEVLPFDGFALSVESEPDGATVAVDGRPFGETPVMSSVTCAPGAELKVRVEKAPLAAREIAVRCREKALVKVTARLAPAGAPSGAGVR
jgi:hypothetical protein